MRLTRAQIISATAIVLNQHVDCSFNIMKLGEHDDSVMLESYLADSDRPNARFNIRKNGSFEKVES